jgi:hypothetical protein
MHRTERNGYNSEWWAREDSNLQPVDYEPNALPLSYAPLEPDFILFLHDVSELFQSALTTKGICKARAD